jgi:hypothetical protein
MKTYFFKDPDFIDLYNAVADILNFCYDNGKGWVGTETIRKSGKFLKLIASLSDSLKPFETAEEFVLESDWQDHFEEPDEDFMLISDTNADSLRLQFEGEEK